MIPTGAVESVREHLYQLRIVRERVLQLLHHQPDLEVPHVRKDFEFQFGEHALDVVLGVEPVVRPIGLCGRHRHPHGVGVGHRIVPHPQIPGDPRPKG